MISKSSQNTSTNILKNPVIVLLFLLCIGYVVLNVIKFGGDNSQTIFINTVLIPPLALLVTLMAFLLMLQVVPSFRTRALWLGLVLGFACWTIAETIWAIAFIKNQEAPYPSLADLFWFIGYFPMYIALWLRLRSITEKPGRMNEIIIVVISLFFIALTFFGILLPILQNFDPSAALESALNLFYPLADTILIILALRILFTARQGTFAQSWFWISLGFIFSSVSDLFFTYSSGLGVYYPNGQANLISVYLVDVPYTLSYLFFLIGMLSLWQMKQRSGRSTIPQGRVPVGRIPVQ